MGAPSPKDIDFVGGRLAINPSDFTAPWPHGGTGLGCIRSSALVLSDAPYRIWAQEWGQYCNASEQGQQWSIRAEFRTQDEDLLNAVFRSTPAGASSGLQHVKYDPGSERPGALLTNRSHPLFFTPDNPTSHRGILLRCAVPTWQSLRNLMMLDWKQELVIPIEWEAYPPSSGTTAEWVLIEDL